MKEELEAENAKRIAEMNEQNRIKAQKEIKEQDRIKREYLEN